MQIQMDKNLMSILYKYFVENMESYYIIIMKDYGGPILTTHLKYLYKNNILGMKNGEVYDLKNMHVFKQTDAPNEFKKLIED